MARIGAKLFYLRTREQRLSQQEAAGAIQIRQATLSHLEQGLSHPNFELLQRLCEFYDVTPTFLVDDARGVRPRPTERWTTRDALVTVGMFVEARVDAVEELGGSRVMCPLEPGFAFFDAEAADVRRRYRRPARADAALADHAAADAAEDVAIEALVEQELRQHPKRRRTAPQPE